MKTYIVKLVVVDDLGSWGPRTSTSTIFLAKTMCAFALMYIYISLKSQNHTESSVLRKEKKLPITLPKIYMCFYVIIVNWMIIFYKGSIIFFEINSLSPGGCSLNFMCVMPQMCCGDYFPEHF